MKLKSKKGKVPRIRSIAQSDIYPNPRMPSSAPVLPRWEDRASIELSNQRKTSQLLERQTETEKGDRNPRDFFFLK